MHAQKHVHVVYLEFIITHSSKKHGVAPYCTSVVLKFSLFAGFSPQSCAQGPPSLYRAQGSNGRGDAAQFL